MLRKLLIDLIILRNKDFGVIFSIDQRYIFIGRISLYRHFNLFFDFDILSPACPSRTVLRHVVDRWTPLVVTVLADGPSRFGELRARVGGVTPKVLTQTLRSMERDGLVTRTQLPGVPPRVDYELTDLGRSLQAPIDALRTWIHTHSAQILAHRESYDAVES